MCFYILAGAAVLIMKWIASFFFIFFYRIMGFHQPSPLHPFKEELAKATINVLSNVTAVYALVVLFDRLHLQPAVAVLVLPLVVGLFWSHYNLSRARRGIAPGRRVDMTFDRFRRHVAAERGSTVAETVAGEGLKKRYLIRSEYAYLTGNISGTILGAFLFLRYAPWFRIT
jgi:hypothetical protein